MALVTQCPEMRVTSVLIGLAKRVARTILPARITQTFRDYWPTFEHQSARRIRELAARVAAEHGHVVRYGLFDGMKLAADTADGDRGGKILGLYECELFPALRAAIQAKIDRVINIGCGSGYFAVGLARLLPRSVPIDAFDTDPRVRELSRQAAELNGVSAQMTIGGACDASTLRDLLARSQQPLLVLDCEGAEADVLLSVRIGSFSRSRLIIECHDFIDRSITPKLTEAFASTHAIESIGQGPRNPHVFPVMRNWPDSDRWILMSEARPEAMHWLSMTPLK